MPPKDRITAGWDIGGANVKVAFVQDHEIIKVYQLDCPLWKGAHILHECMDTILNASDYANTTTLHAITMTGELVDYFDDRKHGVETIINEVASKLSADQTQYYAGESGLIAAKHAACEHAKIASANWLASAHYVTKKIEDALFIDIGSTTTDIVCIQNHKVIYDGYSDEQRLIAKELVYCGVVRTPVFALCRQALVNGQQIPIVNEYFANMADVYRIMCELPDYADVSETLDGRGKDRVNSIKRLARMFANDASQDEIEIWEQVAKQVRALQIQMIKDACRHQLMKKSIPLATPIIGAGVGRFLVKEIANELGREYIDYENLFIIDKNITGFNVADCAPAAALACLAAEGL